MLVLGGLLAVASAVLLGAGLLGIFSALADDHVDLPAEGTLEDILRDDVDDGSELGYRVTGNMAIPYDDPAALKAMEGTSGDVITLITCGGTWTWDRGARFGGNYSHRIVVRAERVLEVRAGLLAAPDTV